MSREGDSEAGFPEKCGHGWPLSKVGEPRILHPGRQTLYAAIKGDRKNKLQKKPDDRAVRFALRSGRGTCTASASCCC